MLSLDGMYDVYIPRMMRVEEDQKALYYRACNSVNRTCNKNDVCRGGSKGPIQQSMQQLQHTTQQE